MENNPTRGPSSESQRRSSRAPLSTARRAILDRLLHQPQPVTLASLVTVTGLHENTVREHLTALMRRGLVRRLRSEPDGRGRPAWLYELTDADADGSEYAALAVALASAIARNGLDPLTTGLAAGEEWGRALSRERAAGPLTVTAARTEVVNLLDDLGYQPRTDPQRPEKIVLTRCPLLEAAYRQQEIVCAVHLGIVRGALKEHDADPEGSALVPFAEPSACFLTVPPLD